MTLGDEKKLRQKPIEMEKEKFMERLLGSPNEEQFLEQVIKTFDAWIRNIVYMLWILLLIFQLIYYFLYLKNHSANEAMWLPLMCLIITVFNGMGLYVIVLTSSKSKEYQNRLGLKRILKLEEVVKENPEKVFPAWDLASERFGKRNAENLEHINEIFCLSRWFFGAGLVLIGGSIIVLFFSPDRLSIVLISAVAGIIIEFLCVVILSFYKTLLNHSINYIQTYDRISRVGVALQILDTLSVDAPDEKKEINKTKIHIAKRLFSNAGLSETHREVQETARATNSIESIVGTGID